MERDRGGSGFTLVEVLLVITLLGVLVATIIPDWTRTQNRFSGQAALEQLAAAVCEIRSLALTTGDPCRLQFTTSDFADRFTRYQVIRGQGATEVCLRQVSLPGESGVTVSPAGLDQVAFGSTGIMLNPKMEIRGSAGSNRVLILDPHSAGGLTTLLNTQPPIPVVVGTSVSSVRINGQDPLSTEPVTLEPGIVTIYGEAPAGAFVRGTIDGQPLPEQSLSENETSFTYIWSTMAPGRHEIELQASIVGGSLAPLFTCSLVVLPTIRLDAPFLLDPGEVLLANPPSADQIQITGYSEAGNGIFCNGHRVAEGLPISGAFAFTYPLVQGDNQLTLSASVGEDSYAKTPSNQLIHLTVHRAISLHIVDPTAGTQTLSSDKVSTRVQGNTAPGALVDVQAATGEVYSWQADGMGVFGALESDSGVVSLTDGVVDTEFTMQSRTQTHYSECTDPTTIRIHRETRLQITSPLDHAVLPATGTRYTVVGYTVPSATVSIQLNGGVPQLSWANSKTGSFSTSVDGFHTGVNTLVIQSVCHGIASAVINLTVTKG